jgi:hypothetical protein
MQKEFDCRFPHRLKTAFRAPITETRVTKRTDKNVTNACAASLQ